MIEMRSTKLENVTEELFFPHSFTCHLFKHITLKCNLLVHFCIVLSCLLGYDVVVQLRVDFFELLQLKAGGLLHVSTKLVARRCISWHFSST